MIGPPPADEGARRLGLILLAGLSLGSSAVMVRVGIQEWPPLLQVLLRFALTMLLFALALGVARRALPRDPAAWRDIAISGLSNTAVPVIAFTLALQYISAGVFGVLLALYPLLTAVLAHLLLAHEKLTRWQAAGLALAFGGTLLLVLTGTTGLGAAGDLRGHLLTLAGVVIAAAGLVFTRARLQAHDSLVVTAGQVAVSLPVIALAILAAPLAPDGLAGSAGGAGLLAAITWRGWLSVIYSALAGSFAGYLLLIILTRRYGATAGALPGYLMPVVSGLLGALLLGEVISLPLVGSAALVLVGVVMVGS